VATENSSADEAAMADASVEDVSKASQVDTMTTMEEEEEVDEEFE
jgi:hypothetical protein